MDSNKNETTLAGKTFFAVDNKSTKFEFSFDQKENIRVKKKKQDIKVFEEDGFTYIEFNGTKHIVEIVEKSQNKYAININGVSYAFTIETPISYKRRIFLEKHQVGSKIEPIEAPMPGKIVEVMVEEGDEVNEGDAIVILEAMKMQNEIITPVSGIVKKVSAKKEANVMKDDLLIEIEKA